MPRSVAASRDLQESDRRFADPALVIRPERIVPHAVADYIYDLTGELSQMADEAGLDLLAYLLDMARIEAKQVKARIRTGGGSA